MATTLLSTDAAGTIDGWRPTTLAALGKGEATLEALIADNPTILGLPSHGIFFRRAHVLRQVSLTTPDGRTGRPDIVMLTDGGHVVVVEVKRLGNAELSGRPVIAQVTDYAATFASLDEGALCRLFSSTTKHHRLRDVAAAMFPETQDPSALGEAYLQRLRDGDLILVVACDEAPPGAREWIDAVANQSALAFKLLLIEVQPWVCDRRPGDVFYVPRARVETEIIARTAVTIRKVGGEVTVEVSVDSADAIRSADQETKTPVAARRLTALVPVASRLAIEPSELWHELLDCSERALRADWPEVYAALAWQDTPHTPYLRGRRMPGYHDGRLGVDLVREWKPSLFVGVLIDPRDHATTHSVPDLGPDFVVIVSVHREARASGVDGDTFLATPEFELLRARLRQDAGEWDFHDHLGAVRRPNRWHPLHLRRPLAVVFKECLTPEARREAWFDAARDGVATVLRGGELAALVRRFDDARVQVG